MTLCTKEDVKAYMGGDMEGQTKYDSVIDLIVPALTLLFEGHCGRYLEELATTEYFDSDGYRRTLQVKRFPIKSSVAVTIHDDPDRVFDATTFINSGDYSIDHNPGIIRLDTYAYFTKGINSIKVAYTGGYAADTVPADLKLAAIIQAVAMLRRRVSQGKTNKSTRNSNANILQDPIVPEAKKLLERFLLEVSEY